MQDLARNIGGAVAQQKIHHHGHIFGPSHAPERQGGGEFLLQRRMLFVAAARGQKRRVDRPRPDGVHTDSPGRELRGDGLGERIDRRLRGGIGGVARHPHDGEIRGRVDDGALAPLHHLAQHALAGQEDALHMGGHHQIPVALGDLVDGIAPVDARHAVATIASKIKDGIIRDGQKLKLLTQPNETKASPNALLRVIVYDEERALAALVRNDKGQFITIAPPVSAQPTPTQNARRNNNDDEGNGVSIYQSLYETGARNDIPRPVIEQLMKVFFFDIDLQKEVDDGDQIELFYNDDDERDARKEVLFAALTIDGVTKRYYRFQNNSDGTIDHFDESGRSNRRFLIRKPITEGILRSGFGLRYHPVLHYSKMHTGVDWADKIGTPIIAAGDGVVIKAEWDSGYGRRVEIQHNYNFVTTYNHLSAFAAGINEGVKVRQGQVIGYLGNSGLSTGPHLHYEVMVNDNYVDPLSIKLPSNKELDRAQMAEFKRERERIDDLLKQTVVTSSAR